jgi:hypothetical protein
MLSILFVDIAGMCGVTLEHDLAFDFGTVVVAKLETAFTDERHRPMIKIKATVGHARQVF